MIHRPPALLLAAAMAAAACVGERPIHESSARLELIERGLAIRETDPSQAADLMARAGPGAVLERTRMNVWHDSLQRAPADTAAWRRLLASRPPIDLTAEATVELAAALAAAGDVAAAIELLENAPAAARDRADQRLLELAGPETLRRAARRLAVSAPQRLRASSPDLEAAVLRELTAAEWLERSVSWRLADRPSRCAAELRALRFTGADERRRVLELARCEVAAGRPSRALRVLPTGRNTDDASLVARAEAYRLQGWQRVPRSTARDAFRSCLQAALRAADGATTSSLRRQALKLVVECGTEAGALDDALSAWWQLESLKGNDDRRDWLGRRLGVAVAQSGRADSQLERLATALPRHARCLEFWSAAAAKDTTSLRRLADGELADLYGQWARELTESPLKVRLAAAPAVHGGELPWPVQWLADRGELAAAAAEWRGIQAARHGSSAEYLAAADLAERRNRRHEAIGWLRSAYPELGTVELASAPVNVIRAYLPLQWEAALLDAAEEFKLEPWLLAGVARQESLFVSYARSPRGAIGILQLIPDTARGHSRALGLGSRPNLRDPELNIRLGARELAWLMRRFGAVEPALAAYNAGETRTRRWWKRWPERRRFTEAVPIPETYNYIRRVTYLAEAYRLVYPEVWRSSE